ncbi:hypothetical protein BH10BAC6_BH10BAC6_12650 [soil metagenome]
MFYWRTTFSVSSSERAVIDEMGVSTLYVRYLDVQGYSVESAEPEQPIQTGRDLRIKGLSIVPTVFIVSSALNHVEDSSQVRSLASKLIRYMLEVDTAIQVAAGTPTRSHFQRLLLDYDWTPSTSHTFFQLLRYVQELLPTTSVESTIRLWQYHNPSLAGIPPVKRGILMCYNMESYEDLWTTNAVASIERFKQYVTSKTADSYPVLLDIAYPVFRQSVYQPGGNSYSRSMRIIHTSLPVGRHVLQTDTVINNEQYRAFDVIRVDGGTADLLTAMHDHVAQTIPKKRMLGTSLFAFDTAEIKRIGIGTLHNILSED